MGTAARSMPGDALSAAGPSLSRERVSLLVQPAHWSGLYNTAESALLLGVKATTIRQWRFKRLLLPQGLDEKNRPLHTAEALREAEALVRQNGIEASGIDPRQTRGKSRAAAPEAA